MFGLRTFFFFLLSILLVYAEYDATTICLERPATGHKLLITDDHLYLTHPDHPDDCQVFEYEYDLKKSYQVFGKAPLHNFVIKDSRCFLPGPRSCQADATYFVKLQFSHYDNAGRSKKNLLCLGDFESLSIGTTDDVCCLRLQALIGEWEPSDDCSRDCDCSDDCADLPPCLTRTKHGEDLQLTTHFEDEEERHAQDARGYTPRYYYGNASEDDPDFHRSGSLVFTADGFCFIYPFKLVDELLIVGRDECEQAHHPRGYSRKLDCKDPYGKYYCSIRGDTATLYYREDSCDSRTAILGASWVIEDDCAADCECDSHYY